MATWAAKKQVIYISITGFIFLVAIGIPVYFQFFNKKPTCFDKILGPDERGIDCGGICSKLCAFESKDPLIIFERIFDSGKQEYSLVAMIENNNQGVYARRVNYSFRTYDENNILLDQRNGATFIPPNISVPILEHSVFTGERIPARTTFSFFYPINWQRGEFKMPKLEVVNVSASSTDSMPIIEAEIINNEVYGVGKIQAIALVYDENNNAMAASQTIVDIIPAQGKISVVFTWNKPFSGIISKIDIIPRALPRGL